MARAVISTSRVYYYILLGRRLYNSCLLLHLSLPQIANMIFLAQRLHRQILVLLYSHQESIFWISNLAVSLISTFKQL